MTQVAATTARRGGALLAACLVGGASGWSLTAAGAGASSLGPAYGVGLVTIGLMTTALAVTYAALQVPAGALVDRVGVRVAAVLGLGVVVLAYLLAVVAPLPWLALACRAVAGAGCAVCFVSGAELVRRSGAGASGLGVFGGVSLAACGAAVVGVPLAEPLLGWRSAWWTSGGLALVALAAVLRVGAWAAPERAPAGPRHGVSGAPGRSLLRDGELHRLAAVHAVALGLGVALSNWVALLLASSWGFSRPAAAVTGSLVLGLSIASRPLGGHLARSRPDLVPAVRTGSLVVCAAATAALAVPTSPVVAVLAVVALGGAGGLPFAAVLAAAQARRPDRPAAAVGLLNTGANAVVLLATPLLGAALERSATTGALLGAAVVWLLPLLAPPAPGRPGARAGGAPRAERALGRS